ncbi:MAG: class I SAM-dependent methyltransferase [Bacteroidota bacterium]
MAPESINHCLVCNSENIQDYFECKDHFVSQESFQLSICNKCGFIFTNPRPALDDIGPYYDSEAYVSHSKTSAGIINRLFHLSRIYTLSHKRRILKNYSSGNNHLDYGCGTGEFLGSMQQKGWNCTGIEPNASARDMARQKFTFDIFDESALDHFSEGSFNSISLWHVMEHIYPVEDRIRTFHKLLDEKGMLFVALPNMQSYDAKRYKEFWAAWDVPRHIYHFKPSTIQNLMKRSGFELVKIKPMFLDAFYISMLSEKYKHGKSKNIQALMHGMISNFSAMLNQKNYSSLIYIFKKSN